MSRHKSHLSRRSFLASTALSIPIATLQQSVFARLARADCTTTPWHEELLLRRDDLVYLRVRIINFVRDGKVLRRRLPGVPAYLSVEFPPQHTSEQAFTVVPLEPVTPPLTNVRTSGGPDPKHAGAFGATRLVFEIEPSVVELPYTMDMMLSWGHLIDRATSAQELRLTPRVVPPSSTPRPPIEFCDPAAAPQTVIEMPLHLTLSPAQNAAWQHSLGAMRSPGGLVELWTTQLVPSTPLVDRLSAIAAWADDFNGPLATSETYPVGTTPFLRTPSETAARTQAIRHELVDKTMGAGAGQTPLNPPDLNIKKLALSSLGGWLDAKGDWQPRPGTDLELWHYIISGGRDQYTRVQTKVYFYPYGHTGAEVAETERAFEDRPQAPIAPLRRRQYLIVREVFKDYTEPVYDPKLLNNTPHTSLRFITERSPDLAADQQNIGIREAYVPRSQGKPVLFEIEGIDHLGNRQRFLSPVIVIPNRALGSALSPSDIAELNRAFERVVKDSGAGPNGRTALAFDGASIAFTPAGNLRGVAAVDSQLVTEHLNYVGTQHNERPYCAPMLNFDPKLFGGAAATVKSKALEHFHPDLHSYVQIKYAPTYCDAGFDLDTSHGKLGIYAHVMNPIPLDFAKDFHFVAPNLNLKSLSATTGFSGLDETKLGALAKDGIDFTSFFSPDAKLFGGLKLSDVLAPLLPKEFKDLGAGTTRVPGMTMIPLPDGGYCFEYKWRTSKLKSDPLGLIGFEKDPAPLLELNVKVCANAVGEVIESSATIALSNFSLNILGSNPFIEIGFETLSIVKSLGHSPVVSARPSKIKFAAGLEFLQNLMSSPSFTEFFKSKAISPIKIDQGEILARYPFRVPSIEVGAFSLSNIAFVVGASIPLDGKPTKIHLGFAERTNPFLVSTALLGGGGWFGMAFHIENASPKVDYLEGAIELGGYLALNVGVATARAYAFVGIYFRYEPGGAVIQAYARFGGAFDILGLITVSVEFHLSLTYDTREDSPNRGSFVGRATLSICIEMLFFSTTVFLDVKRCFKASKNAQCAYLGAAHEEDHVALHWPGFWSAFA